MKSGRLQKEGLLWPGEEPQAYTREWMVFKGRRLMEDKKGGSGAVWSSQLEMEGFTQPGVEGPDP